MLQKRRAGRTRLPVVFDVDAMIVFLDQRKRVLELAGLNQVGKFLSEVHLSVCAALEKLRLFAVLSRPGFVGQDLLAEIENLGGQDHRWRRLVRLGALELLLEDRLELVSEKAMAGVDGLE